MVTPKSSFLNLAQRAAMSATMAAAAIGATPESLSAKEPVDIIKDGSPAAKSTVDGFVESATAGKLFAKPSSKVVSATATAASFIKRIPDHPLTRDEVISDLAKEGLIDSIESFTAKSKIAFDDKSFRSYRFLVFYALDNGFISKNDAKKLVNADAVAAGGGLLANLYRSSQSDPSLKSKFEKNMSKAVSIILEAGPHSIKFTNTTDRGVFEDKIAKDAAKILHANDTSIATVK